MYYEIICHKARKADHFRAIAFIVATIESFVTKVAYIPFSSFNVVRFNTSI